MCEIDFDGYCDVWRETERTARKEHKCSSCGLLIIRGDKYIEHFDIYDGETNRSKCCMACDADRKEFGKAHDVGTLEPRSFPHYLEECIYDDGHDEEGRRWLPMLNRLRKRQKEAKKASA